MDTKKNRVVSHIKKKEGALKRNKASANSKIKERATEKNRVTSYFKMKKELKDTNKDISEVSFLYQRIIKYNWEKKIRTRF